MAEPHRTEVESGLDKKSWRALCSCGWMSRPYDSKRLAEHDGDEHVIAMAHAEDYA